MHYTWDLLHLITNLAAVKKENVPNKWNKMMLNALKHWIFAPILHIFMLIITLSKISKIEIMGFISYHQPCLTKKWKNHKNVSQLCVFSSGILVSIKIWSSNYTPHKCITPRFSKPISGFLHVIGLKWMMRSPPGLTVVLLHCPPRTKLALLMHVVQTGTRVCSIQDLILKVTRDPLHSLLSVRLETLYLAWTTDSNNHCSSWREINTQQHHTKKFDLKIVSSPQKPFGWVREGKVSVFRSTSIYNFRQCSNATSPKGLQLPTKEKIYVFFLSFKNVRDTEALFLSLQTCLPLLKASGFFLCVSLSRPIYINTVSYYLGILPV